MSTDAVISILSSFGFPMATLIFFGFVFYKYLPKFIRAYSEAKNKQQMALTESQARYNEQSDKIIKIAMDSALGLEHVSQALNQSSEINLKIITQQTEINEKVLRALLGMETKMTNLSLQIADYDKRLELHDKHVENIYSDISRILELVQYNAKE